MVRSNREYEYPRSANTISKLARPEQNSFGSHEVTKGRKFSEGEGRSLNPDKSLCISSFVDRLGLNAVQKRSENRLAGIRGKKECGNMFDTYSLCLPSEPEMEINFSERSLFSAIFLHFRPDTREPFCVKNRWFSCF